LSVYVLNVEALNYNVHFWYARTSSKDLEYLSSSYIKVMGQANGKRAKKACLCMFAGDL